MNYLICGIILFLGGCLPQEIPRVPTGQYPSEQLPTSSPRNTSVMPPTIPTVAPTPAVPTISTTYTNEMAPMVKNITKSNEVIEISHKEISDIDNRYNIMIWGRAGANQTVRITKSKFQNSNFVILIGNVDNVEIIGNYFKDVGTAIRINNARNITVRYNKVKNFGKFKLFSGAMGWSSNFCIVAESPQLSSLDISYNLVDRLHASCGGDGRNVKQNVFTEDYINIYKSQMDSGNKGHIAHNYIIGSEQACESTSGGGIIIDQLGSGFIIENNVLYNTGQYLIGAASSSNIEIRNNLGFMTFAHDFYLRPHNHSSSSRTGPEVTYSIGVSQWGEGKTHNVHVVNNRVFVEVATADGSGAKRNTSHVWFGDSVKSEVHATGNNFPIVTWGYDSSLFNNPTQNEVLDTLLGQEREELFKVHGQGANFFQ